MSVSPTSPPPPLLYECGSPCVGAPQPQDGPEPLAVTAIGAGAAAHSRAASSDGAAPAFAAIALAVPAIGSIGLGLLGSTVAMRVAPPAPRLPWPCEASGAAAGGMDVLMPPHSHENRFPPLSTSLLPPPPPPPFPLLLLLTFPPPAPSSGWLSLSSSSAMDTSGLARLPISVALGAGACANSVRASASELPGAAAALGCGRLAAAGVLAGRRAFCVVA